MSRIGPMVEEHMSTTELYRDTGAASDSRRLFAYGDHVEADRIGTRSLMVAMLVILTLLLLVAVAR